VYRLTRGTKMGKVEGCLPLFAVGRFRRASYLGGTRPKWGTESEPGKVLLMVEFRVGFVEKREI